MGNRLLEYLSPVESNRLIPFFEACDVRKGQCINDVGDTIRHVYFPYTAVISHLITVRDGGSIEVAMVGCEGMSGLPLVHGIARSSTKAIVQMEGHTLRMRADDFTSRVLRQNTELRAVVLCYAESFTAMIAAVAACNGIHAIEERLARWILLAHDRGSRRDLPLTQEFLSQMLAVHRPSVTVAARALQQTGAIRYERGCITVVDRARLESISCECYGAIEDETAAIFASMGAPPGATGTKPY